MVAFTPVVQADFSGTAFGSAPTWTDITRFARLQASPISINKWRQDELSDVAPSTMTLVLDNEAVTGDATAPNAGRFTPGLSTSPWYPHILPGVRIRVGVTVGATTYWRFDGYAESWAAAFQDGEFGVCTVTASDMLAQLGGAGPLQSVYIEEVLADGPTALYPLTEPAGSTTAADVSGNGQPALKVFTFAGGDVTFAAATGIPTDQASTVTVNKTLTNGASDDLNGSYLYSPRMSWGASMWLEAWITVDPNLATALSRNTALRAYILSAVDPSTGSTQALFVGYTGGLVKLYDTIGATFVGTDLNDGRLHQIAVVHDTVANTRTYYIDGASVYTAAGAAIPGSMPALFVGGFNPAQAGLSPSSGATMNFRGGIGYATAGAGAPSSTRIAQHYLAGLTAFAGEGTAARIARLLTYRKNLGSILDAGQGTITTHDWTGATVQQELIDTGKAEGGVLYADPATGKIVFLDRKRQRNPAVTTTLDVTAQQTDVDLAYHVDRQQLLNDVTITRTNGATQRRTDLTSKNTYGTRGSNETLPIGTDVDTLNAVGWKLANGKDVRLRTPTLTVDLLGEPSSVVAAAVLNLTPLQRVTLTNPPASAPTTDVVIQGCTDTIGIDVFTCSFNTSPMPRPTLRFDAAAGAFTKLDAGNVFAW